MLRKLIDWLFNDGTFLLQIPYSEESEGILILGDPGVGKSQLIHQMIDRIRLRSDVEAGVCFDPACEFLAAHFNPETDIVLNPMDNRFPYWSPSLEVVTEIDRQLVAESLFPYKENISETNRFFLDASRDIFEIFLSHKPTAQTIVEWLCNEEKIDELVADSEIAHKIDRKAGPQRVAVLSTLAKAGKLLKMLPPDDNQRPSFSLTNWAKKRTGWIFITSSQDTREALRPLQAVFLNILMKRLLSVSQTWGMNHPCWLIVDEVHALNHLPMLPTFIVESRKYGAKYILGTQNKQQLKRHYGDDALTMLSAPHLKIFMRCNEADSAKWIVNNIGDEEREKLRVGTTSAVDDDEHESVNFSTVTERRAIVSKEQIMALPNLHGYWKYSDVVVPFRLEPFKWPKVAKAFEPIKSLSKVAPETEEFNPLLESSSDPQSVEIDDIADLPPGELSDIKTIAPPAIKPSAQIMVKPDDEINLDF